MLNTKNQYWNRELSTNTLKRLDSILNDLKRRQILSLSISFHKTQKGTWALIYSNSEALKDNELLQHIVVDQIELLDFSKMKETTLRIIGFNLEVNDSWRLTSRFTKTCLLKVNIDVKGLCVTNKIGLTPRMIRILMRMPLTENCLVKDDNFMNYLEPELGTDATNNSDNASESEDKRDHPPVMQQNDNTGQTKDESRERNIGLESPPVKEIFLEEWEGSITLLKSINFIKRDDFYLSFSHTYISLKNILGCACGDLLIDRKGTRKFFDFRYNMERLSLRELELLILV